MNRLYIFKKHFLVPLGWMLSPTLLILYVLSQFNILSTKNLVDFFTLVLVTLPFFSYSLSEKLRTLSDTWRFRTYVSSASIFCLCLVFQMYMYLAGFEPSQYIQKSTFINPLELNLLILVILYISAHLTISLSRDMDASTVSLTNTKKSQEDSLAELATYSAAFILTLLGGIFMRIIQLTSLELWIDETTTVLVAKQINAGLGQSLLSGMFYDRAIIYHHYLAWFLDTFSGFDVYIAARVANIPFFFISMLGIFFLGSYVYNKKVGIIASALFSFSWISVSMFREARFYEMFTSLFVILCFLLVRLDDLITKTNWYSKAAGVMRNFGNPELKAKIIFTSIWILIIGVICFDTQELVGFILYPLIAVGILIFIFNKDPKSLLITFLSFFTLVAKIAYDNGSNFKLIQLIKYPQPDWKMLQPDKPFGEFFHYLSINQYSYIVVIGVLLLPLLFTTLNRRILYIFSITAGWYSIVAYQGYSASAIRYIYPALPFLTITVAYVLVRYAEALKNGIHRFIFSILILTLVTTTAYGGWVEGNSATERNSKNTAKNANYDAALNYIVSTGALGTATMLTDKGFSTPYYLLLETSPDYIVVNNDTGLLTNDEYVNSYELDYRDIGKIKKPAYYIFSFPAPSMGPEFIPYLNSIGKVVYQDKGGLIYYFPPNK